MANQSKTLFSQSLSKAVESEIPYKILESKRRLEGNYEVGSDFLKYNKYLIIPIKIHINLPNRGVVNKIDIQEIEPVLIFFDKDFYPFVAPQIRPDRLNFPSSKLPHLNPVPYGEPPSLCLSRGSIDDWYSEHSLPELVSLGINWFQDAARGKLMKLEEGDRFEETRIDINQWIGMSIYEYQKFTDFINNAWKKDTKGGFAFTISPVTFSNNVFDWVHINTTKIESSYEEYCKDLEKYKLDNPGSGNQILTPGLLLWADESIIVNEYFGNLPKSLEEFKSFSSYLGFDIDSVIQKIENEHKSWLKIPCPIFLCIQRPSRLIHHDTKLEILSFWFCTNGKLYVLPQREPLNSNTANNLSMQPINEKNIMFLGCGALGSKIGLHFGRAGISNLTFVDNDFLSPHNLIRHALLSNQDGKPKAIALQQEILNLFSEGKNSIKVESKVKSVFSILSSSEANDTRKQQFIIDTTASKSVLDFLIEKDFPQSPIVLRCEITHSGKLGIILSEGTGRSPKLDDLESTLYDMAIENPIISDWLNDSIKNKLLGREEGFDDIVVGLGCNSSTMKLSDDIVSYHAASQSIYIKKVINGLQPDAGIFLSRIDSDSDSQAINFFYKADKYKTLPFGNTSDWTFRIKASLIPILLKKTAMESPNETGGILIGRINQHRKTVHITRIIDAPPDSEGFPFSFKMGVINLSKEIIDIYNKTGQQIYYLGEWHSHPNGGSRLSSTDKNAMNQIKNYLDKMSIPTIVMVVTPTNIFPYLFSS